ncbi:MAG: hypothetical protein JNK93_00135 [Planctomycetia bacterium]|nr:hypothetical protein [Planctomycetia bacterium]
MNGSEAKELLERVLRIQHQKYRLIVAIYLPLGILEALIDSISADDLRPGSVGRYRNVPLYAIEWIRKHDEWLIERFEVASYGYIQMDNID